jgi:Domain of unknown function (DUF4258)
VRIIFSDHAEKRIDYRELSREQIIQVAAEPEQIIEASDVPAIAQSRVTEHGKMYLIRVAFRDEGETRLIITVYRTSKISKYWQVT